MLLFLVYVCVYVFLCMCVCVFLLCFFAFLSFFFIIADTNKWNGMAWNNKTHTMANRIVWPCNFKSVLICCDR